MTNVYFREYYDHYYITLRGHSGFSRNGEDIVCAGISTLAYTLLNVLSDEEASGNIKFIRNIVCDGFMHFEFSFFDFSKERIKGIVDMCLTGLMMLEENYPEHIRIA